MFLNICIFAIAAAFLFAVNVETAFLKNRKFMQENLMA